MTEPTRMGPGQNPESVKQIEILRARIRTKGAALVEFMNSAVGKGVIEALEDQFYDGDIFNPDPYVTARNCGQRDVVSYLKQLQRISERD
jgi:hypothetical protein